MNFSDKRFALSFACMCPFLFTEAKTLTPKNEVSLAAPPNILIVTADDLGYSSVGAYGCKVKNITPNIDRFAKEGLRFTNAFVNSAVCQPCRQSLLTGRYPHNNGAEGFEPIRSDVPTLPEQLKKAGYINGILGKEIHHQPVERFFWDFIPFKTEMDSIWRKGNSRTPSLFRQYSAKFFSLAKEQKKPFFLIANSHDPHRPFIGSALDTATWGKDMPPITRQFKPDEVEVPGYLPDIPDVRKEVAQYFGNVYRCDLNIGAVLDALEESGLSKNTLVIFLSDHGASFPFSKAQCYLNSTKTPLMVRWPGKTVPGTVDSTHLVSGVDLMPTIMEAAGISLIPDLDGRSYLPVLLGKKQADREYFYSSFYQIFEKKRFPMRCVQEKNFGYIYNFWSDGKATMTGDATGGMTWKAMVEAAKTDPEIAKRVELYRHRVPEEFYDLKNDPDALINRINDPKYAAEIAKLQEKLLQLMKKSKDPACEAFKNRMQPGVVDKFMMEQREKALKTGRDIAF
jgi:N-sulfoglucosamine sulfohydrolase